MKRLLKLLAIPTTIIGTIGWAKGADNLYLIPNNSEIQYLDTYEVDSREPSIEFWEFHLSSFSSYGKDEHVILATPIFKNARALYPIDVYKLHKELVKAGALELSDFEAPLYYRIPKKKIKGKRSLSILLSASRKGNILKKSTNYKLFDYDNYQEMKSVPSATKKHYKLALGMDRMPVLYFGIPLVIVEGDVDLTGCGLVLNSTE